MLKSVNWPSGGEQPYLKFRLQRPISTLLRKSSGMITSVMSGSGWLMLRTIPSFLIGKVVETFYNIIKSNYNA